MPAIKYKDKTYGSATFPFVEMTKEEYDMLSPSKQNDGTLYLISDDDEGWEAERCVYDNTQSGLVATNIQDALDELSSDVLGDFATIETSTTASKAYVVGDYFMYGGKLYKVTSAITQGDTIVPNTNVEMTTVGEEVKNLKSSKADLTNSNAFSTIPIYHSESASGSISALQSTNKTTGTGYRLQMEQGGGVSVYTKAANASTWSGVSITDQINTLKTTPISTDVDVSVSSKKTYATTMNAYSLFKNNGASTATLKLAKAGSYIVVASIYNGGYYNSNAAIGIASTRGFLSYIAGTSSTWSYLSISGDTITISGTGAISACAIYIAPPSNN